jgi:TPR repeat protein
MVGSGLVRANADPNATAEQDQSNWQKIIAVIQQQSDTDDPKAMGIMASFLRNGDVGYGDLIKAESLANKSDSLGSPFGTYELGVLAEKAKNTQAQVYYKKAYPELLKLAEDGDYFAQNRIAAMCYFGMGVEKDPQKAFQWAKKAADQGYPPSQQFLGYCYYDGDGVEKDPQKGFQWTKKAADQGYPLAMAKVASKYADGDGVEKDPQKAFQWAKKAAEQNENLTIKMCEKQILAVYY